MGSWVGPRVGLNAMLGQDIPRPFGNRTLAMHPSNFVYITQFISVIEV
jgi:hypothetical protein